MLKLLPLSLILLLVPFQAFAESVNTNDPNGFIFSFKKFYFDFTEFMTTDQVKKAELKVTHANEIDKEIHDRIIWNNSVPQDMVDTQKRKLDEANQIVANPNQSSVFATIKSALSNAFDRHEIRQIQADFSELRKEQDQSKRAELAKVLDDKINRPSINITCLGRIDSMDIANSENPYSVLQERCKILKLIP